MIPLDLERSESAGVNERPAESLSLLACSEWLQRTLPGAPSYVTLKRWAAAGVLTGAACPHSGVRPRYVPARLADIVRARGRGAAASTAPTDGTDGPGRGDVPGGAITSGAEPSTTAPAAELAEILQAVSGLADQVRQLAQAVQGIATQQATAENALADLAATRRMLMVKSDGEVTALRQRAERAEEQVRVLMNATNPVDAARLARLLSQVEDALRTCRI